MNETSKPVVSTNCDAGTVEAETKHPPKTRKIEELVEKNIPYNKMNDKEKASYVRYLEETNILLKNQIESYKNAFTDVKKENNNLQYNYNVLKTNCKEQITFAKETVRQAYKTLLLMKDVEEPSNEH